MRFDNVTLRFYVKIVECQNQNATFCYQKVATRSRSVSVHLDLSYDALRVHRRGRGDKTKN